MSREYTKLFHLEGLSFSPTSPKIFLFWLIALENISDENIFVLFTEHYFSITYR